MNWRALGVPAAVETRYLGERKTPYQGERKRQKRVIRTRDQEKARAQNSGVFLCLPDPFLDEKRWELEVEERVRKAVGVLREFRGMLRAGKPIPDYEEQRRQAAIELLNQRVEAVEKAWRGE